MWRTWIVPEVFPIFEDKIFLPLFFCQPPYWQKNAGRKIKRRAGWIISRIYNQVGGNIILRALRSCWKA
jgi:hypothetical protein